MTTNFPAPFARQYDQHLKHLKLKGLQPKTIDAYSRAIRRLGAYFHYRIEALTEAHLTEYFSDLMYVPTKTRGYLPRTLKGGTARGGGAERMPELCVDQLGQSRPVGFIADVPGLPPSQLGVGRAGATLLQPFSMNRYAN